MVYKGLKVMTATILENVRMTKRIGKTDVEFYYGGVVMTVAKQLTTKNWESISYRWRQRLLNKAVDIVQSIMNDDNHQSSLYIWLRDAVTISQQ